MITIGRVCVKIAGRDSGKKCIVTEIVDFSHVMIAGETRPRKCNIAHLEPLPQEVKLKAKASASELEKACKDAGMVLRKTTPKKPGERPRQRRGKKAKQAEQSGEKKTESKANAPEHKKPKPAKTEA